MADSRMEDADDLLDVELEQLLSDAFLLPRGGDETAHALGALGFPARPAESCTSSAARGGKSASNGAASAPAAARGPDAALLGNLLLARDRRISPFSGLTTCSIYCSPSPAQQDGLQGGLQQEQQEQLSPSLPPLPPQTQTQQTQQQQLGTAGPPPKAASPPSPSSSPSPSPATTHALPPPPHEEFVPPKRGRGRPPKVAGTYSKSYSAVREYRNRSKNRMAELTQQLNDKLEQLSLLTAENQALQAREVVLQIAINENDRALAIERADSDPVELRATAAADAAAGKAGGAGLLAEPGEAARQGQGQQQQQQQQAEGAARSGDDAAGPSPAMQEMFRVYREYIRRLRARVVNGRLEPLPPWQERYPPRRALMRLHMQLRPEEGLTVLTTNMETGERVESLPEGWWQRVADAIEFSPEQEARISAAMDTFFGAMQRLMDQRKELRTRLADALHRLQAGAIDGAGVGVAAGAGGWGGDGAADGAGEVVWDGAAAVDHKEILDELRANLIREDRVWTTTSWALAVMVDEQQLGTASLLSWPYAPRMVQVCAAKFKHSSTLAVL